MNYQEWLNANQDWLQEQYRREVEGIMSLEDDAWKFIDNFDDYCYRYYEEWKNEERLLCQNN